MEKKYNKIKKTTLILVSLLFLVIISSFVIADQEAILEEQKLRVDLISITPSPVQKGKEFNIGFKVENYGSKDLTNVKINIAEKFPFSLAKEETREREFITLKAGESKTINYGLFTNINAQTGTNKLSLEISIPSLSLSRIQVATFDIEVSDFGHIISIDQVITIPTRIPPGEESRLMFNIQNSGETAIRDIVVKLDFDNVPITPLFTTNERRISFLNTNDQIRLDFDIIADSDAKSKPYKIPIEITFYDLLGQKTIRNSTLGAVIYSPPQIQFDLEESKVFTLGKKGKIIISASNIGPSDVKFLSIELKETEDYDILSNKRVYLGNSDSDDFETAEFDIVANKKTNQEGVNLLIEATYKDAFNKEFKEEKTIPLDIFSSLKAKNYNLIPSSNFLNIIVYIIIIVFIYSVYKDWRKEKDLGKAVKNTIKKWFIAIITFLPRTLKKLFSSKIK